MGLIYELVILLASLVALPILAETLVDSSVKIARALRVSKTFIGLTLLAYGSSLPEFAISTMAAEQSSSISIGNVFGSNIFNITVVIGIMAFLGHLKVPAKKQLKVDSWFLMASVSFVILLLYLNNGIGLISGFFMVSLIIGYSAYVLHNDRKINKHLKKDSSISKARELWIILFSLVGVLISGKFAVGSAVEVARTIGMSEWVIGATILAVGTSLPELVISLSAIRKREFGMSIGNIIGSCAFNVLWVLGIASWIHPLTISFGTILVDSLFVLTTTGILLFCITKGKFTRNTGGILLLMYLGYIAYNLGVA